MKSHAGNDKTVLTVQIRVLLPYSVGAFLYYDVFIAVILVKKTTIVESDERNRYNRKKNFSEFKRCLCVIWII